MKLRTYDIQELLSGDTLRLKSFEFPGTDANARAVYLQASLHGAEIQGNLVIEVLLRYFAKNPPKGRVTLVPFCNPIGAGEKLGDYTQGRYDPVSGANWNRSFVDQAVFAKEFIQKSQNLSLSDLVTKLRAQLKENLDAQKTKMGNISQRLSWQLQRIAIDHDVVLDLHCDMDSLVYAYAPDYAIEDLRYLDIEYGISMSKLDMGAMQDSFYGPWQILANLRSLNKNETRLLPRAFTLELGNQEVVSREAAVKQAAGIINYLKHLGVVATAENLKVNSVTYADGGDIVDLPSEVAGLLEFLAPLGKICEKESVLLTVTQLAKLSEKLDFENIVWSLKNPLRSIPMATVNSHSVLPGMDLVKLMTNFKVLE